MIGDVPQQSNKENVMNGQKDRFFLSHDSGLDEQSDASGELADSSSIYEDAIDSASASSLSQTSAAGRMEHLTETQRLQSLRQILDLFFSNKIREAEALVEPHTQTCVNHSHVKMYFSAMSAMMTLDPVSQ